MKIFTKKGNGLKYIGEGMAYSKGQLKLTEAGLNVIANNLKQIDTDMNSPSVTSTTISANALKNVPTPKNGTNIKITPGKGETVRQVADKAKNMANATTGSSIGNETTFTITKPGATQTTTTESKNRKLTEMRNNSIAFNKNEFLDFLRSI